MKLTRMEKMKEYYELVERIGYKPTRKDQYLFSDGSKVVEWFHHLTKFCHQSNEKFTTEKKEEQRYARDLWDYVDTTYGENAKYKKHLQEFYNEVKTQKRMVRWADKKEILFSDGVSMYDWYYDNIEKFREWEEKGKVLFRNEEKQKIWFQKLQEAISPFQPTDMEIFQKQAEEFLTTIQENQKMPTKTYDYIFSDGTKMYHWYDKWKNITKDWKEHPEKMSKEDLIKFNLFQEIQDYNFTNLTFHAEYIRKIRFFANLLQYTGSMKLTTASQIKFDNGVDVRIWKETQDDRFIRFRREDRKLNEYQMAQLYYYALLENYAYDLEESRKQHVKKR